MNNISKKELRTKLSQIRDSITQEDKAIKNWMITERIIETDAFEMADFVMAYCSFKSEVDTNDIILGSFMTGKAVALPKVINKDQMKFYLIKTIDEYEKLKENNKGHMGIPEPTGEEEELEFDDYCNYLMLVPGLGFSKDLHRIGYGGGYYDKYIATCGASSSNLFKMMLAYDEQRCDDLPYDDNDAKMSMIVTDKAIYQ